MIAAFIFVMSLVALIHFAITQWRSMWIVLTEQPLSNSFEAATGIAVNAITAEDFTPLLRTLEDFPAPSRGRNSWLKEVRIYYKTLQAVSKSCEQRLPALADRTGKEAVLCAKYVAAILDQRLNTQMAYAAPAQN